MPIILTPIFEIAIKNEAKAAKSASDIISNNRNESKPNTTINIQPKSASEILQQNSGSAANASKNYGTQSQGAGQKISSLTSGYINKPTTTTSKLNMNPTFSNRGI